MSQPTHFDHILLTRFNVRAGLRAAPPPEPWLRNRLELFRRWTVPSIAAQSSPPDQWLVFVDVDSPDWLVEELGATIAPVSASIVEVDGEFSGAVAARAVADVRSSAAVITTRVDNDDALGVDFLRRVREAAAARAEVPRFLNVVHGFQIHGGRVYRRSDPSNAFLSLVENPGNRELESVFVCGHHLARTRHPVSQLRTGPLWMQVVHGENAANRVSGIRVPRSHAMPQFAAVLDDARESAVELRIDQVASTARLVARVVRDPARLRWAAQVLSPRS